MADTPLYFLHKAPVHNILAVHRLQTGCAAGNKQHFVPGYLGRNAALPGSALHGNLYIILMALVRNFKRCSHMHGF